jgi:hypothetical protein
MSTGAPTACAPMLRRRCSTTPSPTPARGVPPWPPPWPPPTTAATWCWSPLWGASRVGNWPAYWRPPASRWSTSVSTGTPPRRSATAPPGRSCYATTPAAGRHRRGRWTPPWPRCGRRPRSSSPTTAGVSPPTRGCAPCSAICGRPWCGTPTREVRPPCSGAGWSPPTAPSSLPRSSTRPTGEPKPGAPWPPAPGTSAGAGVPRL